MAKGAVIVLVGVGVAAAIGVAAYALSPSSAALRPVLPGPPPPPPPSLNQTIYQVGSDATKIGLSIYEKATGSAPTGKDVALTVATGGAYIPIKSAVNWVGKLF